MDGTESFDIFGSTPNGIDFVIEDTPSVDYFSSAVSEPAQEPTPDASPAEASLEQSSATQFNTVEEARAYYENLLNSTEWQEQQNIKISEYISQKQQEIEDFAVAYKAMQTDPMMFFAKYIPEALASYGVSPVLTDDQIADNIDKAMKQEFGEDYRDRWNVNEMIVPGSFSQRVYARQNEVLNELSALNARNREIHNDWLQNVAENKIGQQAQEQATLPQEALESAYNEYFKDIYPEKQEYKRFINAVKDHKPTLPELHQIAFFNDYIKLAYTNGLEAGKKQMLQGVRKEGTPVMSSMPSATEPSDFPLMGNLSVFANGGLPIY